MTFLVQSNLYKTAIALGWFSDYCSHTDSSAPRFTCDVCDDRPLNYMLVSFNSIDLICPRITWGLKCLNEELYNQVGL